MAGATTSSKSARSSPPTTTTCRRTRFGIPVYRFRSDIPAGDPYAFPFEAQLGFGDPDLSLKNNQFGVYAQDDWTINSCLTVNIGLRWDYESDMLNNDYVTPALVDQQLSPYFGPEFFTDGSQRPTFTGAVQPRVGLAWDLTGQGETVLFGGWGRYYDRVEYNAILDEQFRLQYSMLTFRFSADGQPRDGQPTIIWNPIYLTQAGLESILGTSHGAQARGLPDQQQHRPALLGPVQRRHPPAVRAGGRVAVLRGRAVP